jgi:hypothetical protein
VPFLLQIFGAVSLVGYLSYRNGEQAVENLANQLMDKTNRLVTQHLDTYLSIPKQINRNNADAIALGLLDIRDLETTGHFHWKQVQNFNITYIGSVLKTGEFIGAGRWLRAGNSIDIEEVSSESKLEKKSYSWATDREGNRAKIIKIEEYKPLEDDCYQESIKAAKPIWCSVYIWDREKKYLAVSTTVPIYDRQNRLIGITGTDFVLNGISEFLRGLEVSPSSKIVIVEKNGLLIAGANHRQALSTVDNRAQRLNIFHSQEPIVQFVAKYLQQEFGSFRSIQNSQQLEFPFQGEREFVQVTPWRDNLGLDWLVIVIIPESDFMGQISSNTRTTIVLCLAALAVATILGICTSRWITQPILRLIRASEAMASGNLDQTVTVNTFKELGVLANSFNQMASQLRQSFTTLEQTNEELEMRVETRTSELKLAKEAADTANRAKSDFLASMSHELRTPLNAILGYAQILQEDKTASPKQLDGLRIVHQCSSHLLRLINDILDIAKIEAQKLELYPTEFHFEKFLQEVGEMCRIRAEQKEIAFYYEALNRLPYAVRTDEKRLRQVLINLLGNAIKFTDKGKVILKVGVIEPSQNPIPPTPLKKGGAKSQNRQIRFQVEDTGIGMTPAQLEKIFLPFEQVGDDSQRTEGTGLGLSISRKIVEMMGGEIQVESTYGVGSKFWFDINLPEVTGWVEPRSPQDKQNIIGYQGKQRTILIVDDRWENRAVLIELLAPIGFQILAASNGQEGLEIAQERLPDLIITDLFMPVMNGLEMTQRLRQETQLKDIIIIASSASVLSFDRQQSREAGCDDFLPKPLQVAELIEQLQTYLGLEWIYDSNDKAELISQAQALTVEVADLAFPPAEELKVLYQAAVTGYIAEIEAEAHRFMQLDAKYIPLAETILKLAAEFEDEAIISLVQSHL